MQLNKTQQEAQQSKLRYLIRIFDGIPADNKSKLSSAELKVSKAKLNYIKAKEAKLNRSFLKAS